MQETLHLLKEWLMEYGVFGLFFVSFADSSFFPIPPDLLLIPMGLADSEHVYWYAFLTTFASVIGAIFGWYIGFRIGRPVLRILFKDQQITKVEMYFQKLGPLAILISAFTPLPFKIFTILSGISKMKVQTVVLWATIGRGARFYLEAILIHQLGHNAVPFIKEHFTMLTIYIALFIMIVYIATRYFKKDRLN